MSSIVATALPGWQSALLLSPALGAAVGAIGAGRVRSATSAFRCARAASAAMLIASGASLVVRAATNERAGSLVRSDTVGALVLTLVSFVGLVVVRYSENYVSGAPNERRYVSRMLMTLSAVAVVVVANNLVLLTLAWTTTSLALHGLLTFFGHRRAALGAAHKKFLLARCADISMIGAVIAFGVTFATLRIDRIVAAADAAAPLPVGARIGVVLIALAALLKCAQLPFHGWLIQVMEAPTPVSALLHAGVVNLGGFVLLRFAPVVDRAIETRAVLVVVGVVTAVVAALVMTTRVSVKVSLAWSTCAQMGFMLLQCGLGAWEMALLHLIAHSLYKAHAFLGAGGAVRQTQRKRLAPAAHKPTVASLVAATVVAAAGTAAIGWAWSRLPFAAPLPATVWVFAGIVALAMVAQIGAPSHTGTRRFSAAAVAGAGAVPVLYFGFHEIFGRLVPHATNAPTVLLVIVAAGFALLYVVQVMSTFDPAGRVMATLYPWIYGGLFLDETFTRIAFRIWEPPAPRIDRSQMPRPGAVPTVRAPGIPVELSSAAPTHQPRQLLIGDPA